MPLRFEIFEDIGLRNRRIDAFKIEQVVEIGRRAVGYDRQNPKVVAVVERRRHLVGEAHIRSRQQAADNADGPLVLSLAHHGVAAAFLN